MKKTLLSLVAAFGIASFALPARAEDQPAAGAEGAEKAKAKHHKKKAAAEGEKAAGEEKKAEGATEKAEGEKAEKSTKHHHKKKAAEGEAAPATK